MRRFWIVAFSVLVFGLVSTAPSAAQNLGRIETRLSRLESQVFELRSQLRQLGAASGQPSRSLAAPRQTVPRRATPAIPSNNSRTLAGDPQFDRLATLVIELKERMDRLERRLDQLDRNDRWRPSSSESINADLQARNLIW